MLTDTLVEAKKARGSQKEHNNQVNSVASLDILSNSSSGITGTA